jgi:hypothetical protein
MIRKHVVPDCPGRLVLVLCKEMLVRCQRQTLPLVIIRVRRGLGRSHVKVRLSRREKKRTE